MENRNVFTRTGAAFLLASLIFPFQSSANIVGTDVQNFNPTTNGLDFLTVQSSETLKPGLLNVGFFLNYAANSLAYSRDVVGVEVGKKPGDRILGADFNMGLGLGENWDIGISFPAVLSQQLDQVAGAAKYESKGLTEIRFNTKYRFYGDDSGGFAGVFSVNQNLIRNNPFVGDGAGPTLNYELVMDTTFAEKIAAAVNVGFRKRRPGTALDGVPFEPFGDQYIYSVAANYLLTESDTKLIAEIYGSQPVTKVNYDQDRSLSTLEGLIGIKHDYSQSLALHIGGGSQIQKSTASPDWRVYVGLNYVFGPLWGKEEQARPVLVEPQPLKTKPEPPKPAPAPTPKTPKLVVLPDPDGAGPKQIYRLQMEFLFDFDSYNIKDEVDSVLRTLAEDLRKNGFKSVIIEGHTDSIGSVQYNQALSEKRANGIKSYLTQHFDLDARKLKAVGKGEKFPIADNGNWQGRRENRRVDFIIER